MQNLGKSFGNIEVLKDITVDIYKGDVVFVVGPSGSGKSTFLRCLNRLEEPTKGHIYFEGTDITDPKTDIDKHRQKMGMVFQQFNLFPHMTILDNMTLAPMKLLGRPKDEAETETLKASGACRIKGKGIRLSGQLIWRSETACGYRPRSGDASGCDAFLTSQPPRLTRRW